MRLQPAPLNDGHSRKIALVTRMGGWLLAVAGGGAVGYALVREWPETAAVLSGASWRWIVLGLSVALAALTTVARAWGVVLAAIGHHPPARNLYRWFFLGEMGKYVPGGIWAVVGRAEMAVRGGVPRSHAYSSTLVALLFTYGVAALLGIGLTLPRYLGPGIEGVGVPSWLLFALLAALLLAASSFRCISRRLSRWGASVPGLRNASRWGSLSLMALNLVFWLGVGASTWCLAMGLSLDIGFREILAASSLAWFVGFVVIPAPSGLGVREAVFLWALAGAASGPVAALALLSRIAFMVADSTAALVVLGISGVGPNPQAKPPSPGTEASES